MTLTGVILAGGISSRFGSHKLLYRIGGKPLLSRVANHLAEVADRIVIVTAPQGLSVAKRACPEAEIILDEQSLNCGGPLRGLATAALVKGDILYLPGDAAWITSSTLRNLASIGGQLGGLTTPVWGDGFMPMLYGYAPSDSKWVFIEACLLRGLDGRPSDAYRISPEVKLVGTSLISRHGWEFNTLNTPEDLGNPRERPHGQGIITIGSQSIYYRRGVYALSSGNPVEAYVNFTLEASVYRASGVMHLYVHVGKDLCRLARYLREAVKCIET